MILTETWFILLSEYKEITFCKGFEKSSLNCVILLKVLSLETIVYARTSKCCLGMKSN